LQEQNVRHQKFSIPQILRLPSVCYVCNQYHRDYSAVCLSCTQLFSRLEHICHYCALPLPDNNFLACGQCSKEKPSFDCTLTAYRFEEPLRTLLHEYKYKSALFLRNILAQLMMDALPESGTLSQCLIPIPLHSTRLKERGFNQAAELSKLLAKYLNIPCELTACKKIRNTTPQVNLSGKERRQNLRGAFEVHSLPYQHITLVDDLFTTGSTVQEISRLFKKQGVKRVDVWCCARAPGN
jgi:ComF family protein